MEGLAGLFASSDNLYKFLFIGGVTMFIFSLIYPMQKQQLIDIEINSYNKEVAILNNEIKALDKSIKAFKNESKNILIKLDSIKVIKRTTSITKEIIDIKEKYKTKLSNLKRKESDLNTKNIISEYHLKKIDILKTHSKDYSNYSWWLRRIGVVISIIGLLFWAMSTRLSYKLKKKEYNKE